MGLFIYQTLDAIDGKQARRTGSSNALGELFDHGCDSMSTGKIRRIIRQPRYVRFSEIM
jgi:phosphatidylglycerophosphate synthase